jgi:hypothetical protein
MKALHYDIEGDILSVTFAEDAGLATVGVELSDNIVVYYNPETEQPLKLILISYQAMVHASATLPIELDGIARLPKQTQATLARILHRSPLTTFLQIEAHSPSTTHLPQLFTSTGWQSVAAVG